MSLACPWRARIDFARWSNGMGAFQNALFRRCPVVAVVSGHELLWEASLAQLEQLGLPDRLAPVAITTKPCSGFPNPGNDVCFLTAPLQMVLRLQPVAEALRQHAVSHAAHAIERSEKLGKRPNL